jgi:hypothetical protein
MAYDKLLNLYPDTGQSATAGPTTVTGSAKFLGRNRSYVAEVRVGGDITGAGATLTPTIEESANGTSGWAQIAAGVAITAEQVGYVGGTTPRPEVPGLPPVSIGFTTTKDYGRTILTLAGTTPSFPLTSVTVVPNDTAIKRSGS